MTKNYKINRYLKNFREHEIVEQKLEESEENFRKICEDPNVSDDESEIM